MLCLRANFHTPVTLPTNKLQLNKYSIANSYFVELESFLGENRNELEVGKKTDLPLP